MLHRSSVLAAVVLAASLLALGCSTRARPMGVRDGGTTRFDSGVSRDGGTPPRTDGGTPPRTDGGTPPRTDGGVVLPRDGGFPSFEGGLPSFEGGLPSLEGGLPLMCTMDGDCPPGQICNMIIPGLGFCL